MKSISMALPKLSNLVWFNCSQRARKWLCTYYETIKFKLRPIGTDSNKSYKTIQ